MKKYYLAYGSNLNLGQMKYKIDYHFNNIDLLFQAFTRSSYSAQYGSENNEVLEFIGDTELSTAVTRIIADEFGFMKSQSDYYDEDNDRDEYCIVANKDESATINGDYSLLIYDRTIAQNDLWGWNHYHLGVRDGLKVVRNKNTQFSWAHSFLAYFILTTMEIILPIL